MSEDGAATTEAQAEAGTAAKNGGSQFVVKMIFLALIVLAIVFYVRSLDHQAVPAIDHQTSTESAAPAPAAGQPSQAALAPASESAAAAPAEAPLSSDAAMKEIEALFGK